MCNGRVFDYRLFPAVVIALALVTAQGKLSLVVSGVAHTNEASVAFRSTGRTVVRSSHETVRSMPYGS